MGKRKKQSFPPPITFWDVLKRIDDGGAVWAYHRERDEHFIIATSTIKLTPRRRRMLLLRSPGNQRLNKVARRFPGACLIVLGTYPSLKAATQVVPSNIEEDDEE